MNSLCAPGFLLHDRIYYYPLRDQFYERFNYLTWTFKGVFKFDLDSVT